MKTMIFLKLWEKNNGLPSDTGYSYPQKEMDLRQIDRITLQEPVIYPAFDLCPNPELNRELIDYLLENEIEATFFPSKSWWELNKHRDLSFFNYKQFTIGGHGDKHLDARDTDFSGELKEIRESKRWILEQFGRRIKWYRPPFGRPDEDTFQALKHENLLCCSWAGPVLDKKSKGVGRDISKIATNWIENKMQQGDILMMHANGEGINTLDRLKEVIARCKSEGWELKKLPDKL